MANLFSSEAPRSFFPSSIDDIYRCDSATIDYVILRTRRARCALNKEILDVESVSGARSGRASL